MTEVTGGDEVNRPDTDSAKQVLTLDLAEVNRRADDFVREYLTDKSPATIGTYRRALNEFERWVQRQGGKVRITRESVESYKKYLSDTRGLHQVSVSTYLTALRRLCQYLVDIGLAADNPAREVRGNRRPDSHSREVLTAEEVSRLVKSLKGDSTIAKRDRVMVFLMLYAGLSEIELTRADVGDLEQTLLGWFLRVQGKGRTVKDQQVPLDAPVIEHLRHYLDARASRHPDDPLLASHGHRSEGARLNTRSVRSRITRYLEEAGVRRPGITPHSLTHTAALLWLRAGMDVEEVRQRMRHGTLDTTMIYFKRQGLLGTE